MKIKSICSWILLQPLFLLALPQNPTVQTGGATFTGTGSNSNELGCNVTADITVIDWSSYSVSQGQTVTYSRNGSNSDYYVWNNVTGTSISQIDGSIIGNGSGTIYLYNDNGIVIGPTGTIMTNAFIATTLDYVDSFDPTNSMLFSGSSSSGTITINGTINALNGDVTIIGYRIVNAGTLIASGAVSQAAGTSVLLQPSSSQRVYINATAGTGTGTGISMSGTATGESVILVADGNAYTYAINMSGVVDCTCCSSTAGQVFLLADPKGSENGAVTVTGSIGRTSLAAQAPPVTIIGKTIALENSASINVNGANGGGTITIGDENTYGTNNIYIDGTTSIFASATSSGNGGNITMWADDSIIQIGTITSNGAGSGNGGNVSITTPGYLGYNATTGLSGGSTGSDGTLTLTSSAVDVGGSANYGSYYAPTSYSPANITSTVTTTGLQNTLANANVSIIADGSSITGTLNQLDNISWSSGNRLSLQADYLLQLNYLLTMTGTSSASNTVVSLQAPLITIGSTDGSQTIPSGVNLTTGGISSNASTAITIYGGSAENAYAHLNTSLGTNTTIFNTYMNVLGGSAAGANATVLGTVVNIDGTKAGKGDLFLQGGDCTSAYIRGTAVNMGQNTPFENLSIIAGYCSSGNDAYIGNLSGASTINIDIDGTLTMTGGSNGSSNNARIISTGGNAIPVNVSASTVELYGGTGGSGNTSNIASLGNHGTVTVSAGEDLVLSGGDSNSTAASAYFEGTTVNFSSGRDVTFNGGNGILNRVYVYGYNGVSGMVGRNLTLFGGNASLANAEIKASSGTIALDASSGTSLFAFYGGTGSSSNAAARLYMTGNGNIVVGGQSAPGNIIFSGGSGGVDVYALALVEGNGNITMNAQQDIALVGGGSGTYTQAGLQTLGTGNVTFNAGRDLFMSTGSTASSDVYFNTAQGTIIGTVGRDCTMIGICDLNEAYITSSSSNGGILFDVSRNLTLSGWATISSPTPSNSFSIAYGGVKTVLACSSINGGTPTSPLGYPGDYYYEFAFLYELFYKLHYFTNYDWYLLHISDFWDTMMRTSP